MTGFHRLWAYPVVVLTCLAAPACGGGDSSDSTAAGEPGGAQEEEPEPTDPPPTTEDPAEDPVTQARKLCTGPATTTEVSLEGLENSEASGVAASGRHPGVYWIHGDSGDAARVFAVATADAAESAGLPRSPVAVKPAEWQLPSVTATDWEDIALGPGPDGSDHLHLADIGDNNAARPTVQIHRVREPSQPEVAGTMESVETFHLRYPDGAHDAESFIVDPPTGDWFVVTKDWDGGVSQVFRVRSGSTAGAGVGEANPIVMEEVATVDLNRHGRLATAADVTPSGSLVAVRTYTELLVFPREEGEPLWSAFTAEPCAAPVPLEVQAEAVALVSESTFATIAERPGNRLNITSSVTG